MKTLQLAFTQADFDALPEGFPAQLIGGQFVVEPAPTYGHQAVIAQLLLALGPLVAPGLVIPAPMEIRIDERNVFKPDLAVLRARPAWDDRDVGMPLIVLEVLSAPLGRPGRTVRAPRLLDAGVAEVWLIDPRAEEIECLTSSGRQCATGDEVLSSNAVPGFALSPRRLFA